MTTTPTTTTSTTTTPTTTTSTTTTSTTTTSTTTTSTTTTTPAGPCPGTCTPITTTDTVFTEFGGCCFRYDMSALTLFKPVMTSMDDGAGGCQQHFSCDAQYTHVMKIDMSPNAQKLCEIRENTDPYIHEFDAFCYPEGTNFIRDVDITQFAFACLTVPAGTTRNCVPAGK
ncbi:hypothetical protein WR25_04735 [Diploscapter pachys]|uniref:Uncharacterized protein n=1 Tax=Diploscapter pachys TaxID=2018661 RepID=A0A2A2L634_9BILA|nr:hypothetical protein WR25_04735 [Diploscapter pachys]